MITCSGVGAEQVRQGEVRLEESQPGSLPTFAEEPNDLETSWGSRLLGIGGEQIKPLSLKRVMIEIH